MAAHCMRCHFRAFSASGSRMLRCTSKFQSSNACLQFLALKRSDSFICSPTSATLVRTSVLCISSRSHAVQSNAADPKKTISHLTSLVLKGDRSALSRGITLVESINRAHEAQANELLSGLISRRSSSQKEPSQLQTFRLGISGPPGVGKSSFIETFGMHLINQGLRVAVLTVDPSSAITGGSILGDKTRMTELSKHPNAYVRPSPTWGTIGGLNRATSESIFLCEAAGYDVVIVETVGVGQSEISVRDSVDMVLLLVPPAGGDELQGMKKGIVEIADLIVVNKADGDLISSARHAQVEYMHALQLGRRRSSSWTPSVMTASNLDKGASAGTIWDIVCNYRKALATTGELVSTRMQQRRHALRAQLHEEMRRRMNDDLRDQISALEAKVSVQELMPRAAAVGLVDAIMRSYMPQLSPPKQPSD